jgi:hypothetical protein
MAERWENKKWTQGSVCERAVIEKLLTGHIQGSDVGIFIAVSHDCDIANGDMTKEPFIEFFPVKFLDSKNGAYLYGKNPRILHLQLFKNDVSCFVEIEANSRFCIKKEKLLSVYPNENYRLVDRDKKILQDWLAARYRRHAFPNNLDAILKKRKFWKKLSENVSDEMAHSIQQFRLHFEPDGDIEPDERYELELLIIHDGTEKARSNAEKLAIALKDEGEMMEQIDLIHCEARSTAEVTMDDLGYYEKLNLDYISHKYDYDGDIKDC